MNRILVRDYGVTVVFSTATQPAFARRPGFDQGIEGAREIVPPTLKAFERLRRVRVEWPGEGPAIEWPALADERLARLRRLRRSADLLRVTSHG